MGDVGVPKPMMAVASDRIPAGAGWSYEVKWDGYRTLAVKRGGRVVLMSRNLKNVTAQLPTVAEAVRRIKEDQVLLDGEVVALDASGRPSFQSLQHRTLKDVHVVYYAFDLLARAGTNLMRR